MEYLGKEVSLDTETTIAPFTSTPDLVTCQVYGGGSDVYYVPLNKIYLFLNKHYDSIIIAQNMPFDVDVLHKYLGNNMMYDKYDRNLVRDTGIMYKLLHLATAGFVPFKSNLSFLSDKFLGQALVKDERRENFAQFLGAPIASIPDEYLEYGAIDAIATLLIYKKLQEYMEGHDTYKTLLSLNIQMKGDLALLHLYKNGIRFNLPMKDKWLEQKDAEMKDLEIRLGDWGLIRGMSGYKSAYKHIVETILKLDIPYRYKGLVCNLSGEKWVYGEDGIIDMSGKTVKVKENMYCHGEPSISSQREDLMPYYNSHMFVKFYLDYMELEKATSFVRGINVERVNPRYNLLVNTGRTSCSAPNFQQLPKMGGVREMFVASPNKTLVMTDYSAIELATLAQVTYSMFGESVMRDKLNEGQDLHKYYASVMHSCSVDKVTKQWRQEAKAANFGFPGGLGVKTFIQFSKGYDLILSEDQARRMKDVWFTAFPEVHRYMENDKGHIYTLTGRKRNNTSYCAEKNTPFQGLAADGAKLALYNLDKRGFKIVGFVHDEIVTEVDVDRAEEMKSVQEEIMISSMKEVVPDVKIMVESQISQFYTK